MAMRCDRQQKTYTDEDRETFLLLLEQENGSLTRAMQRMDPPIQSHQTIRDWRDAYPWFSEGIRQITRVIFDDIEANVFSRARKGEHFPSERFLLLNHPEGRRRGYVKRSELTGRDGQDLFQSFADLVSAEDPQGLGEE